MPGRGQLRGMRICRLFSGCCCRGGMVRRLPMCVLWPARRIHPGGCRHHGNGRKALPRHATCANPCTGGDRANVRYLYEGIPSCRAQMMLDEGKRECDKGCLGYGDCVKACLFDALKIGPEGFPVVDEEKCVGCGACERTCPKNISIRQNPVGTPASFQ